MQTKGDAAHEQRLVESLRHGDDAAFEEIFRRNYDRLCRDAQRYVSRDVAEDIVQDVFTSLLVHRANLHVRTTLRKYLHSAVRNRARDTIRRSQSERRYKEAQEHNNAQQHSPSPEDELLLAQLADAVTAGIAQCSSRCQEVLRLAEEYPLYADIARELGIQPGTVQTLLKRGRRVVRAHLHTEGWIEVVAETSLPSLLRLLRSNPARASAASHPCRRSSIDADASGDGLGLDLAG